VGFNQDLGLRREPDGAIRLDPDARHEVAPGNGCVVQPNSFV